VLTYLTIIPLHYYSVIHNYESLNVSSTELKYLAIKPVIYSETNGDREISRIDIHLTAIGVPTNSELIRFSLGQWDLLDYLQIMITNS